MVEKGKAFFEISRSEVKKAKLRCLAFIIFIIFLIASPLYILMRIGPEVWPLSLMVFSLWLIAVIPYLKVNQFGIYECGISPLSKPMRMLHKKEVFIPYNDIVNMGVDIKMYTGDITLKNGKKISLEPTGPIAGVYFRSLETPPQLKKSGEFWSLLGKNF